MLREGVRSNDQVGLRPAPHLAAAGAAAWVCGLRRLRLPACLPARRAEDSGWTRRGGQKAYGRADQGPMLRVISAIEKPREPHVERRPHARGVGSNSSQPHRQSVRGDATQTQLALLFTTTIASSSTSQSRRLETSGPVAICTRERSVPEAYLEWKHGQATVPLQ